MAHIHSTLVDRLMGNHVDVECPLPTESLVAFIANVRFLVVGQMSLLVTLEETGSGHGVATFVASVQGDVLGIRQN